MTNKKPIYTTLKDIRSFSPCEDGWEKLLKHLGKTKADDEPLAMTTILKSNGIDDAIWCTRTIWKDHRKEVSLFAAACAERVLYIFERQYPDDKGPREAIQAVRDFAEGKISLYQLRDKCAAARADASARAADAARAAVWAARAAADAARAAAAAAVWAADAAADAARAAAADAARAAADDAARAAELEAQEELFIKYFGGDK